MLVQKWSAIICLCSVLLINYTLVATGQRNNRKTVGKAKASAKKPVSNGRWVPFKQRLAAKKRQNAGKKNNNNNKNNRNQASGGNSNRGGSVKYDNLIQPPLLRSPTEADLQEPSWSHCLHNVEIDKNWASISSPNFPRPIQGQLQCTWLFEGLPGKRLQLSFNVLDLEDGTGGRCGNQFVDIIDMELLKSQGRFCGERVPGDYVSVGRKLRLDIQADTSLTPHKGFQAAVRAVPHIVQPGLRQRSTLFHGEPTEPPTTTRRPATRRQTKVIRKKIIPTTTTTTTQSTLLVFGMNRYGINRQPARAEILTYSKAKGINTSLILYVFIGLFCLMVIGVGIGLIFRRQLYAKYKAYKQKRREKLEKKKKKREAKISKYFKNESDTDNDDDENQKEIKGRENEAFSKSNLSLPVSRPTTPSLDGRRRKSVIFEDELENDVVREADQRSNTLDSGRSDDIKSQDGRLPKEGSIDTKFQGWNYPSGEPIYEDDVLSLSSYSSDKSSTRRQEHLTPRQQKIIEKNRELMEEDGIYAPRSEPVYHIESPYGQAMLPSMPPPYYPGLMPSYQDPRGVYPPHFQMMPDAEAYARGRPMSSINNGRNIRPETIPPTPVYDDYHQGRFLTSPKPQEDSNFEKASIQPESNLNLTSIPSQGSVSVAELEQEPQLQPTRSMATLQPPSNNFSSGLPQRSFSFTG